MVATRAFRYTDRDVPMTTRSNETLLNELQCSPEREADSIEHTGRRRARGEDGNRPRPDERRRNQRQKANAEHGPKQSRSRERNGRVASVHLFGRRWHTPSDPRTSRHVIPKVEQRRGRRSLRPAERRTVATRADRRCHDVSSRVCDRAPRDAGRAPHPLPLARARIGAAGGRRSVPHARGRLSPRLLAADGPRRGVPRACRALHLPR